MPRIHNIEALGKVTVRSGSLDIETGSLNLKTGSLEITAGSLITSVISPSTVGGTIAFQAPMSGAVSLDVATIIPTGSYSVGPVSGSPDSSTYYLDAPNNPIGLLQYAINNIEEGSSNITGSLCLRLPAPSTGQTVIVNNNTSRNLRVFTSSSSGRFTQGAITTISTRSSGSAFIIPPGPQSATFECVQNPISGVWNVTFPPGTINEIINEFHIDHTFGTASKASFNISPNSTNPYENRAMKVRSQGYFDVGSGANVRGFLRYFDQPNGVDSSLNGPYGTFSTTNSTQYPVVDSTSQYHIPPTEVRNPDDFFTQVTTPYTYITRAQLHTNITSSDYYNSANNFNREGGLHIRGLEVLLTPHSSVPGAGQFNQWDNWLFTPFMWFRDVVTDDELDDLIAQGLITVSNQFERERKSSNTDPNVPSELNRVVPSENPPSYDALNPQIGALHTEYWDTDENPNNPLITNPMPIGGLNGRTIPFVRERIPGTNDFVDTTDYHAPCISYHLEIPKWYATKTYKFRMITTTRTA